MTEKVCAYFGNRYLDAFYEHMAEIRVSGFTAILHPVTEQDLLFDAKPLLRLLEATSDAGLTCWIDPHGIGQILGYGSVSSYRLGDSPGPDEVDQLVTQLKQILDVFGGHAHAVLWDEPDVKKSYMYDVLNEVTGYAWREHRLYNAVCLWGSPVDRCEERLSFLETALAHLDEIGVSMTPDKMLSPTYRADWMARLRDHKSNVWVPGYKLASRHLLPMQEAIREAAVAGIDTIGHWGFRGCEATGYASRDPMHVWQLAGQSMRSVH